MSRIKISAAASFPDASIDYRHNPALYRIGHGERGVLTVEPYKSEILPLWRFKTPSEAELSANAILQQFEAYKKNGDFVGMDMARKFIQMGYTRSRRYARHRSGRKYKRGGHEELPLDPDPEKEQSAQIFLKVLERVRHDKNYQLLKAQHLKRTARSISSLSS